MIVLRRLGNVRRELSRAVKDSKDAKEFARIAQENYDEAADVASNSGGPSDARTAIYNWREKSRWALSTPKPDAFPDAKDAFQVQQSLKKESGPVVVPPVQLGMGIVLLRNEGAHESERERKGSAEKAFIESGELLNQALTDLARDEKGLKDKEKNLKRWAEINYALGTALVGQAVLSAKKRRAELEEQARQTFQKVLNTYKSAGIVRDTCQDLIAIKEAVGRSKFVDECMALFRDNWHPESL